MDIYSVLKKDHNKVHDLMENVMATRNPEKREKIFDEISEELVLHAKAEEATFYAALERQDEMKEKMDDAQEDQNEIMSYLYELSALSTKHESWLERFGELKHAVEHHVKDEEERIFPYAQQLLSDAQAEELGEQMLKLKEIAINIAA